MYSYVASNSQIDEAIESIRRSAGPARLAEVKSCQRLNRMKSKTAAGSTD